MDGTPHGSTSVIACVLFSVTTTRVIEMCVLLAYHLWIHQRHCMCVHFIIHLWIHRCHCMCVLFCNNNQSHFACVFFSHTTYGSTSVIACVFFSLKTTRVIACVFFSHTTYGSTSVTEMCVLYRDHKWIHQCHCMCVLFSNNNQSH